MYLAKEIEAMHDFPMRYAFNKAWEVLYGRKGYGLPNNGLIETVPGIDSGKIREYLKDLLNPSEAVLIFAGDIDNDGDLDVAICGITTAGDHLTQIYMNGEGTFIDIQAGIKGVKDGSLEWGDYDNTIEAIKRIAYRKGTFGNLLADNIFAFAQNIAKKKAMPVEKLIRYIIQIKGMTQSSGDNRLMGMGAALSHGTSTRGSDHLRGVNTDIWLQHDKPEDIQGIPRELAKKFLDLGLSDPNRYEGKEFYVAFMEDNCAVIDSLGICKRHTSWEGMGIGLEEMAEYLNAVTGLDYTWQDLEKCGTRIYNVERAMQARYGLRKKDDYPPIRFFEEEVPSGPMKGAILDKKKYDDLLAKYYEHRGWTNEGIPTKKTLKELGLQDIANDLRKRKVIEVGK